jgi:hypothetical protein
LAALPLIATLAATGLQVMGSLQQGQAAKAAANFEAEQHKRQAAEERAASQREAIEKRHEGKLAMSRQIAVAGASGAGVVNPSILDIYGETGQKAEYNAQTALYGGESRARGQIDQAAAAKFRGKAAYKGSLLEAGGQLFGGLGKAFGKPSPSGSYG